MFRSNGLGPIMRRGMAAFLLSLILLSVPVFALEEGDAGGESVNTEVTQTETDQAQEDVTEEETQAAEDDSQAEDENQEVQSDIVLFSPDFDDEAEEMTVKLGYWKRINYENFHTQYFYAQNGSSKYVAYCIQPTVSGMYKKQTKAAISKDKLLNKVLYYSYGYPGYAKSKKYLDGVSRKKCYKGDNGNYVLFHILLSYVYDGESSSTDAFKGVGSQGKKVVKNLLAQIKTWPEPEDHGKIALNPAEVKAVWDKDKQLQETDDITLVGAEENSIDVRIPEGATLTKTDREGNVTEYRRDDGSDLVRILGGESFRFAGGMDLQGQYDSGSIAGAIPVFKPYIVKFTKKQDMAFGVNDVAKTSFKVNWAEFGQISILKESAQKEASDGNQYYTTEGAEYGIYDSEDGRLVETLRTGADGQATSTSLPYGDYYLREDNAPRGFDIDEGKHPLALDSKAENMTVADVPLLPAIATSASKEGSEEKAFEPQGTIKIIDKVSYSGLNPGFEYTLKGKLVDKESGTDLEGAVSEMTFKPESQDGTVNMEFQINSDALEGKSLVAFEELYYEGTLLASHSDINDAAQTVTINKVIREESDSSPRTGDSNHMILAIAMLLTSVIVCFWCLKARRKRLI